MSWISTNLWLVPTLPLLAAGVIALLKRQQRTPAAVLAISSLALSFVLAVIAFGTTLTQKGSSATPRGHNFTWLQLGESGLPLGWVLDPLSASMLVMVTFVGLLIFIYSVGYMAHDENFTRFFCFLSLFAAAMLGLVIANSLLLLFMCWELVGLASYLLIGFWFQKPSAAAAAKKAFITTRVGDIGFFVGMLWLYAETGTLLFYDNGNGCLEQSALAKLVTQTTLLGMLVSTAISLLIFCGAIGKSGQVPLHVWLPDAMEGPTPVSALIHAATMVAAGVFLVARMYPLMSAQPSGIAVAGGATALQVVAWTGAVTALFAACIAVAQTDIKRILAYSTVSQLGYMMLGLGVGGVAAGMFHLLTHAFFKALLFLGAGSVIHGCGEEQDIRRMGGLKRFMPVTFATYAVGMMALAGVPIFFSGFWSKDEILHGALHWPVSKWPFVFALTGAVLTAFYMTRQMFYVFYGPYRGANNSAARGSEISSHGAHRSAQAVKEDKRHSHSHADAPHESPWVMTVPLTVLAVFAVLLGFLGTPAWPWIQEYLTGHETHAEGGFLKVMLLSSGAVALGIWLAWRLYGVREIADANAPDALEQLRPTAFAVLRNKFYIDELYDLSVVRLNAWCARVSHALDRQLWDGLVQWVGYAILGFAWLSRLFDEYVINLGFDRGCSRLREGSWWSSRLHDGQVQHYLRVVGLAFTVLLILLTWGLAR